jgi:hypothetical protein
VAELREMLKVKGLNSVGNKQELIDRLQAAMSESSGDLDRLEDDLLNVCLHSSTSDFSFNLISFLFTGR